MKSLIVIALMTSFSAFAATKTFKMYTVRNASPNPNCDVHVELKLETHRFGATATLENRVGGYCEIYVEPNPRSYELGFLSKRCGSNHYTTHDQEVSLVDNRGRICDDIVPAMIVLKEEGITFYSYDRN